MLFYSQNQGLKTTKTIAFLLPIYNFELGFNSKYTFLIMNFYSLLLLAYTELVPKLQGNQMQVLAGPSRTRIQQHKYTLNVHSRYITRVQYEVRP